MTEPRRRDALIVIARGRSRRMGSPKGLVTLPGDQRPLLARVWDLYRRRRWPAVVVTRPELAAPYAAVLAAGGAPQVVAETGGGGTARSVFAGWLTLCGADEATAALPPTHVWIHPVDLPLVRRDTVARLLAASRRDARLCLRPVHDGIPGHPVVLAAAQVRRWMASHAGWAGDVRELLAAAPPDPPLWHVPVADAGVHEDVDTRADTVRLAPEEENDHDA